MGRKNMMGSLGEGKKWDMRRRKVGEALIWDVGRWGKG